MRLKIPRTHVKKIVGVTQLTMEDESLGLIVVAYIAQSKEETR